MQKLLIILIYILSFDIVVANTIDLTNTQGYEILESAVSIIPKHTIKAHSRTVAENLRHQKICERVGAMDVTDERDIVVGDGNDDTAICISPIQKYPSITEDRNDATAHDSSSQKTIKQEQNILLTNTLEIAYNGIYPTNGTVSGAYYSYPYANYSYGKIGALIAADAAVPADACYTSGSAYIQVTSGMIQLYLSCSRILGSGQAQSYFQVCSEGYCKTGYGVVNRI